MIAPLLILSAASLDSTVAKVVAGVSEERIGAIMRKLESFGTRDIHATSNADARAWIKAELESYSPKLQVSLDPHEVKKGARVQRDLTVTNVVAKLPGKLHPDIHVMIIGHYDTITVVRKQGATTTDYAATAAAPKSPGVSDNASGVAALMELARVMSEHEWDKTIVFIATSGEEYGLFGATRYAEAAKKAGVQIEAVLNNDIIGNDDNGQGLKLTHLVRLFTDDPADSPSRALGRYVKQAAERYVPSMKVDVVFRPDRFGRGGDHTPFNRQGYAGVRFTTAAEDLKRQHTPNDAMQFASPAYCARVTRVNGAALASLALAPPPPKVTRDVTQTEARSGYTFQPNLARGKDNRDAVLKWKPGADTPDIAGYAIVIRSTTSPFWEREIPVGKVTEFTLADLSIDDVVIGIKAIDTNGVESLVSAFIQPARVIGQ